MRFRKAPQAKRSQHGAVMTEAAISLLVFLGLLGLFTDIGFSLYRYSRIYRVAQDTVKEYSLRLTRTDLPCEVLQEEIKEFALARMRKEFDTTNAFQFASYFTLPTSSDQIDIRAVTINGVWPLDCFLCIFTKQLNVKVWAGQPIEASDFWCSTN